MALRRWDKKSRRDGWKNVISCAIIENSSDQQWDWTQNGGYLKTRFILEILIEWSRFVPEPGCMTNVWGDYGAMLVWEQYSCLQDPLAYTQQVLKRGPGNKSIGLNGLQAVNMYRGIVWSEKCNVVSGYKWPYNGGIHLGSRMYFNSYFFIFLQNPECSKAQFNGRTIMVSPCVWNAPWERFEQNAYWKGTAKQCPPTCQKYLSGSGVDDRTTLIVRPREPGLIGTAICLGNTTWSCSSAAGPATAMPRDGTWGSARNYKAWMSPMGW